MNARADLKPQPLPAFPRAGEVPQPFVNYDPILRDMALAAWRSRTRPVWQGD